MFYLPVDEMNNKKRRNLMSDKNKIAESCSRKLINLIFGQTVNNVMKLVFTKHFPEAENFACVNNKNFKSIKGVSLFNNRLLKMTRYGGVKSICDSPYCTVTEKIIYKTMITN